MHIAFVSESIAPFSSTQGAKTRAALSKGLKSLDHSVTVVSPMDASIDATRYSLARRLSKIEAEVDGQVYACEQYTGRTPGGVDVVFLREPDVSDDALQWKVFAAAAEKIVPELSVDVVHAHGALGAGFVSSTALTAVLTVDTVEAAGEGALTKARAVTATSRTVAQELSRASEDVSVSGILNGVDGSRWNTLTDAYLPYRFDPMDLGGKRKCKRSLQRGSGLPVRSDIPLFVATCASGAGLGLVASAMGALLRNDVQVAVATDLASEHGAALTELASRFSDRLVVLPYGEELVHHLYGAADLLIVQNGAGAEALMCAHRYGALPISSTGYDVAVDCDAKLSSGTAFLYGDGELLGALQRGAASFLKHDAFDALQRRVMLIDHSWDRSARLYERIYLKAISA